jgi:DNA-binding MurR/RpiR family transcriptional regulator
VVDAVRCVVEQGAGLIVISDSRTSPIALLAEQTYVVPTETPQFFTSTVAAAALLETLMAFVVADADDHVIANIEGFHRRRYDLGVYLPDED